MTTINIATNAPKKFEKTIRVKAEAIKESVAQAIDDTAQSVPTSVNYDAVNKAIASVQYAHKLSQLHSVCEDMVAWIMKNYFASAGVDFNDEHGEYYIRYFVTINPNSNGKRVAYAWVSKEMVWCKEQNAFAYEINICPEFLDRPFEELFVSICHELIHLYNIKKGNEDTSRNGQYHNDKFMDSCDLFQVKVEKDKKYGWSTNIVPMDKQSLKVQAMAKAFVSAFKEYLDMFKLTRKANTTESKAKEKKAKTKTYLTCGCTTFEIKLKKNQDIPKWKCASCGNDLHLVEESAPTEIGETDQIGKEILQATQAESAPIATTEASASTEEKKAEEAKAPETKTEAKVEESAPKAKKAPAKAKAPKASAPRKTNTKKSTPKVKKAEATVAPETTVEESAPIVATTKAIVPIEEVKPIYVAESAPIAVAADIAPITSTIVAPSHNADGTVNISDVDDKIMKMMLKAEYNN